MKSFVECIVAVLALGGGLVAGFGDNASIGRPVVSDSELQSVVGAGCFGQKDNMVMICNGGENSGCAGCGCVMEHPKNDKDMGYAAPSVNCDKDPNCKYEFRRGSCTGE